MRHKAVLHTNGSPARRIVKVVKNKKSKYTNIRKGKSADIGWTTMAHLKSTGHCKALNNRIEDYWQ